MIDYLKGNKNISSQINKIGFDNICVNDVIIMELFIGALNKSDLKFIKNKIKNIAILEINQEIISLTKDIIEHFSLSHGCKINDALIASTSIIYDLELYTANIKDFKYIPGVKIFKE